MLIWRASPFPDQIHGMLRLVGPSRLLYGSDYPYTREPLAASLARRLDVGLEAEVGTEIKSKILLGNAKGLIARPSC